MSAPDYQKLMLPLLKMAADGNDHAFREAYDKMADEFELSKEERSELLPSGTQQIYKNRIGLAKTYIAKAHLLSSPKRGYYRITDRGPEILNSKIDAQKVIR